MLFEVVLDDTPKDSDNGHGKSLAGKVKICIQGKLTLNQMKWTKNGA